MSRAGRVVLRTAGVVLVVIMAAALVVIWFVRRPFPDVRGRQTVAGVSAPVEILRDDDGVPHIYASTEEDLYFAQGYVHAQDRFWQMEFWRRIGSGRLSEILGASAIDQDRYLRTMGFADVARREYELMPTELRAVLDAYARGVNAYIADRKPGRLGLEFALLGLTGTKVEIEPWTPVHSVTWGKIMALDLGTNMGSETANLSLVRFGGIALFDLIRAPYREDMPYIVSLPELASFRERLGLEPPALRTGVAAYVGSGANGIGSNNWVIGPQRTQTGLPLLANDMHLAVQIPSIWYEAGLHLVPDGPGGSGGLNLRGFSFAGVPGIIGGQNDHVAWGMTNLGGDVQDLFLERVNPDNPDQYWDGTAWQDMEVRIERIDVSGEDPVFQKVRSTPRGPILTDLPQLDKWFSYSTDGAFPDGASVYELSLSWTALQPDTLFSSIHALNHATDAAEVREALRLWGSPGQNLVYADDAGNIGYQSAGDHPNRDPAMGRAPQPGWGQEPVSLVPFDDLPAALNPEKGYIVTANNPVVSPEYVYPLALEFANGLRARRIADLIESYGTGIGADEIRQIHVDVFNRNADELMPYLEQIDPAQAYADWLARREEAGGEGAGASDDGSSDDDRDEARHLALLLAASDVLFAWDRRMDAESAGAAVYGYVWNRLITEAFADELPAHYWPYAGVTTFESAVHVLLREPEHPLWDDRTTPDHRETSDDILGRALVGGILDAADELGDRPGRWEWGQVHRIEFRNATLGESGMGTIERLFNRGPFPLGGGVSTVNVANWRSDGPFDVTSIASERAIYDLADPSASRFTHPTGQSGHPFHRHYLAFFDEWRSGEYHPARWTREEVEASAGRRVLTLEPAR